MGAFGKTPKSIRFPRHPIQFHQTPQSEAFLAQPIERNAIPPAPHGRPRRPPKACCSFTIFFCFVTEFFFNFTKRGTCYGVRWKGGVRGTPSLVPLREHTHTHRQRDRERERERERESRTGAASVSTYRPGRRRAVASGSRRDRPPSSSSVREVRRRVRKMCFSIFYLPRWH